MKTLTHLTLIALLAGGLLLAVAGCGGDDGGDGPTGPTPESDATVLAMGWIAWEDGDWLEAETQFYRLLDRQALLAEAHDGLGWTFLGSDTPDSASAHFAAAVTQGADTLDIADQVRAGQALAASGLDEHQDCLDAAALVDGDWEFDHDADYDHDDMVVLRAVSHYALAAFADALTAVQELEPTFTADVGTVDGRAALAAKIEELSAG